MALAACSAPQGQATRGGIHDPYEAQNRKVHAFNLGLDRALLGPSAKSVGNAIPDDLRDSVSNFDSNLSLPGSVVNNLLQGDLLSAGRNTLRLVINTTLGFGGLFDPAGDFGLTAEDSDFGETLHVWGVGEGAYVELPLLGPSTERDAVGTVVDFAMNPLRQILPTPERHYVTGTRIAAGLLRRDRFSTTIDSILYESADSYAQARLIYLQNRRFALGGTKGDAYSDPYGDAATDPYADAQTGPVNTEPYYTDPYAD